MTERPGEASEMGMTLASELTQQLPLSHRRLLEAFEPSSRHTHTQLKGHRRPDWPPIGAALHTFSQVKIKLTWPTEPLCWRQLVATGRPID